MPEGDDPTSSVGPVDTVDKVDDTTIGAGLDALDTPTDSGGDSRSRTRRVLATVLPPVVALVAIGAIWQALWAAALWPEFKLPAPAAVGAHLWDLTVSGDILGLLWTSVHRAVIGFLVAVAVAVPLGLLIANFRLVRRGIGPLVSGLQSLPSVAWVPAAVLWFGLTDASIYFVVLLGAVPSIANGLVAGIDQIPPILPRVGHVMGAGRLDSARLILLPAALPGYIAGCKQ